jgi:excisionase family DNA binding protein
MSNATAPHSPAPADAPDPLLTPAETAEYLKVSVRTLDAWRYRKTGPRFIHLGRHVRYRRSALEDFLRELEAAAV